MSLHDYDWSPDTEVTAEAQPSRKALIHTVLRIGRRARKTAALALIALAVSLLALVIAALALGAPW